MSPLALKVIRGIRALPTPHPLPAQITAAVNLVANWCREDSSTKPTLINPDQTLQSAKLPQVWNGSRNDKDSNGLILKMVVDLASLQMGGCPSSYFDALQGAV